jgi:hypothetical protein
MYSSLLRRATVGWVPSSEHIEDLYRPAVVRRAVEY